MEENQKVAAEAKKMFQKIHEAYSGTYIYIYVYNAIIRKENINKSNHRTFYPAVLSDKGKRTVYDAGLFGLLGENDDEVSLFHFYSPRNRFSFSYFRSCISFSLVGG